MKLLSSRPFWPVRDGIPATYPPLDREVKCEVAVIGGGITGAMIGWELTKAGIETVILDRREAAHGSTAGSTSLLQYEIDEPLHRLIQNLGETRAVASYRRCRDALRSIEQLVRELGLECGYARKRSLLLASKKAHVAGLRREFEARRDAGFSVEWWTREQLAKHSTLPQSAAIMSRQGAQIDAYQFAYGLLEAARRKGAQIYERTTVKRTHQRARGVVLETSRGFNVHARWLVVAAGYEAGAFLPEPVIALHSTYAIISHPVSDFSGWPAKRCLIWETARPYVYMRTTEDNRILMGGYDEPFRDADTRDSLLGAKTVALKRRFRQLFPKINFELAQAWAGTFAETKHGLPYIGRHAEVRHTWFALGYGGNGITYSMLAAELIRDQILGRPNSDEILFGFNRPQSATRG